MDRDEGEDEEHPQLPQRAQLTLTAPLSQKDESFVVGRLEHAGYEAPCVRELVNKLKASGSYERSVRAQPAQTQVDSRSPGPARQGSTSAMAALPSRPKQLDAADRSRYSAQADQGSQRPTAQSSDNAQRMESMRNLERLARNYRVDLMRLSQLERERLAQLPLEEQSRRLLYILHGQDKKTYNAVVEALRRQRGQAFRRDVEESEGDDE